MGSEAWEKFKKNISSRPSNRSSGGSIWSANQPIIAFLRYIVSV